MAQTGYKKLLLILLLLTGMLSACEEIQTAQKHTLKGTSTKTPFNIKSTFTPTKEPPPTYTPSNTPTQTQTSTNTTTITDTPLATATAAASASPEIISPTPSPPPPSATATTQKKNSTAGDPTVKVSLTTNCRTGPGITYPKLSVLKPGKSAPLVGRDKNSTYWIIKDPGQTGQKCWIWGYYATTTGNTNNLKVFSDPGSPTKKVSITPVPTAKKTTPPVTKTPKNTSTPIKPIPTNTPNLTPGTATNTALPASATPIPSDTPIPSNTLIPTNTSPPSSGYCPYTSILPGEEAQIQNLINNARAKRGLPKLTVKVQLVEAARDHGRDMTCHGTYGHTSTDGTKAWERISVALGHSKSWCYNHCCCSEIYYGGGSYLTPEMAFDWWMNHASQDPNYKDNIHKRTILGEYSTKLGVGVIYYEHNGTIRKFYTVDFAKPK